MAWEVTLNGNTYTDANIDGNAYANTETGFKSVLTDFIAHGRGIYRANGTGSLTISDGTKTLTVDKDRPFFVTSWVAIVSASLSTNWMQGEVTAYDPDTGSLTVSVPLGQTSGSGTATAWLVYGMGKRGATGDAATLATENVTGVVELASRTEVAGRSDAQRVVVPAYLDLRDRSARTSNVILGVADRGHFIDVTSGTFTQTVTAAATLGPGWWCRYRNNGTGDVTIDPNGSELIDGLTSYVIYPGETRDIFCDGTALYSVVVSPFSRTFSSGATFVKPPGYSFFDLDALGGAGGGGSGARRASGTAAHGGGGGGGGARRRLRVRASDIASTVSITIGAGGAGGTTAANDSNGVNGGNGGNTSFGSHLIAYGGAGGYGGGLSASGADGGGGGSELGAATATANGTTMTGVSPFLGGSGGSAGGTKSGSASIFGGGGGGASNTASTEGAGGGSLEGGAGGGAGGGIAAAGNNRSPGAGGSATATSGGGGTAGNDSAGGNGAAYQGGGGGDAASNAGNRGGNGGKGGGGGGGSGAVNDAGGTTAGGVGGAGELVVTGVV